MEKLKEQWLKFLNWFNSLSLWKKIAIIGVPLLLTIFLLGTAYLLTPHYGTLFSNLDPTTLQEIEYELSKLGVDYEVDFKKGVVYVPENQVEKLRLYLTEKGIISPQQKIGFEIFDKQSFSTSDFVEHVNYLRALEGELEKTIKALNAVEDVKVNIALPKQSIFSRPEEEPKASVLLKLKPGMDLTPEQIKAIRDLVAASVVGLKPQNVVIVDQYGRDLTALIGDDSTIGLVANQLKLKEQYEHKLERQIERILSGVVGFGNAKVKVSLYLDFSHKQEKSYEVNPDKTAIVSQQREKRKKQSYLPEGVPGTESNIPPGKGQQVSGTKVLEKEKKSITNYEISYIQKLIDDPTINIKKVSVGVILNANIKGVDPQKIKEFLINSLGLNPKRGDTISVVVLPFKGKQVLEKILTKEKVKAINWKYYAAGALLLTIGLSVLAFVLLKRRKVKEEIEVYGGLTGAPTGAATVSEKAEESLIKQLSKLAKENPELYKKLLLQWLKNEE
jgi:flagellar M-ring protein FliF